MKNHISNKTLSQQADNRTEEGNNKVHEERTRQHTQYQRKQES